MRDEAIDVGLERAADLELEIAVAVGGDHLLQALRQAVVQPLARRLGLRQRIDQPDGVAHEDRRRRRKLGEECLEIEAREVGRGRGREAEPVGAHQLEHRARSSRPSASMIARSISASPNEATSPLRPCARKPRGAPLPPRRTGRRRCRFRHRARACARCERAAQLVEIVLVGQSRRLVEPFRHQQLGGNPLAFASVGEPHARAHERLRRLGQRHHAETERQPQLDRPLVERRLDEAQPRACSWVLASLRPRR